MPQYLKFVPVIAFLIVFALPASAATKEAPSILEFSSQPAVIKQGASATLSWRVSEADGCQLRRDSGTTSVYVASVSLRGSYAVKPTQTTTYELFCSKATRAGVSTASKKLTVTVLHPAAATLYVEPTFTQAVLMQGGTTTQSYGVYVVKYQVTADGDDLYIPVGAATAGKEGAIFSVTGSTTSGAIMSSLVSTADLSNGFYIVREGDTETFTITVTIDPSVTGNYRVGLTQINYSAFSADDGLRAYVIGLKDLPSFQTPLLTIPGGPA